MGCPGSSNPLRSHENGLLILIRLTILARAGNKSGAVGADIDNGLVELVWKYFGEEISQTLRKVQQALGPDNCHSTTGKSLER